MRAMKMLLAVTAMVFLFATQVPAAGTIKIASVFAKSGVVGASNLHHVQAVRYAVDEINQNGGLLGKQVELVEFDNSGTPIQSRLAAMKAVKAKVVAVVGASWSDHSLAMAPVLQKAKIPMISPDSTNAKVTKKGDYIFRACFIDPFQGEVLSKFVVDSFSAKTAVLFEKVSSSYSIGLADSFKEHFEKRGGKVLGRFEYTNETTNYKPMLEQIKALNADILFIPGHDESGAVVKQAQEVGITSRLIGGDGWGYRAFMSNGGRDLKRGYYSTHWTKDVDTPVSKAFVAAYQKVYEPNDFAAVSYDAVGLLADAIRRAGSTDGAAIKDALASTKDYVGVTGTISMQSGGDPIKPAVIIEVENGKAIYLDTVYP